MKKYMKWLMPGVQAVLTAVLLFMLAESKLLPAKYMGLAAAVLVVLLGITVLLARSKKSAGSTVANILAIFISGMLLFGVVYVRHFVVTLEQIASTDTQVENIAVAVQAGDKAQAIEDTSGYLFGVYEGKDKELLDDVTAEVTGANGDAEMDKQSFDSPVEMAQALLAGDVDAVICNKAYIDLLDDAITDYSGQTRIIYEKSFETVIEEDAGEVGSGTGSGDADGSESGSAQSSGRKGGRLPGEKIMDHPFNVLISGIDVSGPITSTSRSDVNIIMTINPQKHRILLTTTPRDYYVFLPGISGDERDKLTHAGVYGIRASMRTLEELYDVDISDHIRINFDSLVQLVDALGGVDVNSEVEFTSGEYTFHKGINHMDGDQALAFSRARYQFASGDNQRGQNQMLVLTAILEKMQSPEILRNPSAVLDVIGKSMQTSFTSDEMAEAIAWQLDKPQGWEIDRQAVIGTGDSQETFSMKGTNLYVMWPDEDSVQEASDRIKETLE